MKFEFVENSVKISADDHEKNHIGLVNELSSIWRTVSLDKKIISSYEFYLDYMLYMSSLYKDKTGPVTEEEKTDWLEYDKKFKELDYDEALKTFSKKSNYIEFLAESYSYLVPSEDPEEDQYYWYDGSSPRSIANKEIMKEKIKNILKI